MLKVVIVAGPTGSGKTKLAIRVAKNIGGEIINADSRQVYKGMDIGTDKGVIKPVPEVRSMDSVDIQGFDIESSGVISWLFDIYEPDRTFSLAEFKKLAEFMIKDISSRGKVPVIVGGTGLYIDSLVKGYRLSDTKPDWKFREKFENYSCEELTREIIQIDPKSFEALNNSDRNNPRRLLRLLEKIMNPAEGDTGNAKKSNADPMEFFILYPSYSKEELYEKINSRVVEMVNKGLVDEYKSLADRGYRNAEPMQGMGYKEAREFMEGKTGYEEMIEKIQQAHRNYAKRQATWFEGKGRGYDLHKFKFDGDFEKIISELQNYLEAK